MPRASQARVDVLHERLDAEAREGGYTLNPDVGFTRELVEGLIVNKDRYGYMACPCRLADGVRELDADIICPCDYRDPDLDEHGTCYCALYVSDEVASGERELTSIPDRRPADPAERGKATAAGDPVQESSNGGIGSDLKYPIWRCKVCGYLCAREKPPAKCTICKADRDRFERFL